MNNKGQLTPVDKSVNRTMKTPTFCNEMMDINDLSNITNLDKSISKSSSLNGLIGVAIAGFEDFGEQRLTASKAELEDISNLAWKKFCCVLALVM